MGIFDKVGSLLPWRDERRERHDEGQGALALRDDFDRWLGRLLDEPASGGLGPIPSVEVMETHDAAGLDVDRAEARVANGVLTVTFPKVDGRPGTRRIAIKT